MPLFTVQITTRFTVVTLDYFLNQEAEGIYGIGACPGKNNGDREGPGAQV